MKKLSKIICIILTLVFVSLMSVGCDKFDKKEVVIGIAWRADTDSEFYTNITASLEEIGVKYKLLDQVKLSTISYDGTQVESSNVTENAYLTQSTANLVKSATVDDSNVKSVVSGVDGVIFTGGEDISPTLYQTPVEWHGILEEQDYNGARDINDYLLLSYCIDANLPAIGFCRGMQMLGVVCGATVIQDIPTYFNSLSKTYDFTHRNNKAQPSDYRDYAPHNVVVLDRESLFYKTVKASLVLNVPSWHHQAVLSVEGTALKVTGKTNTCGIDMIEALEYQGKTYIAGYQFHPEASIVKNINNVENKGNYMSKDTALKFFNTFVSYC